MNPYTRFLTSGFFHQTTSAKAVIHMLKPFQTWLQVQKYFRKRCLYHGTAAPVKFLRKETLQSF
jgi:hypothetical protein